MANTLTVFRLISVPVFFGLLAWSNPSADKVAFAVFGIAAITDLFDGYIARRFKQVTEFGRLVDPLADRALIVTAIVALFMRGVIPTWALAALLLRDGMMVLGYWLTKELNKPLVPVNQMGRVSNFYLMVTIFLLLFHLSFNPLLLFVWAFYLGVVLYMVSGLVYIIQEATLLNKTAKETDK
ncbi:MAG: CDP-diacylglycerol--glycerol-3-phosphate 3-phosphatidyltransferase [Actinomycetota bacterium]